LNEKKIEKKKGKIRIHSKIFLSTAHKKAKGNSQHKVIDLQLPSLDSLPNSPVQTRTILPFASVSSSSTEEAKCPVHPGKSIKLFCKEEKKGICKDCALGEHKKHEYVFLEDMTLSMKNELKDLLSKSEKELKKMEGMIQSLGDSQKAIRMKDSLTCKMIEDFAENLIKAVNQRREQLLRKSKENSQIRLRALSAQKKSLENAMHVFYSAKDFLENLPKNDLSVHNILTGLSFQQQISSFLSSPHEPPEKDDTQFAIDSMQQILSLIQSAGTFTQASALPPPPLRRRASDKQLNKSAPGLIAEPTERVRMYYKISKHQLTFGKKGHHEGEFLSPVGVTTSLDGKIFVADQHNHRIQIFERNGKFLAKIGGQGTGDGKFHLPTDVAVDGMNRILVTDQLNHRVQIFQMDGKLLKKIGGQGSQFGNFDHPVGIAVNKEGLIFVTDHFNHRVQVFRPDGGFLSCFGSHGTAEGQFQEPTGIEIDKEGRVIVCDHGNQRLQIFRFDGGFISQIKWKADPFSPTGIAVDVEGNLIVTDEENHRINIMGMDGHLIAQYGTKGHGEAGFLHPTGVAVDLAWNRIIVTDSGNQRIVVV
jgi:DNA-binding beta-propeller fold protein YncE